MIKTYKPTSAGIRFRKTLVREVSKSRPEKSLIQALKGNAGRNSGKISSGDRIRGTKKFYRIIDFKRNKKDIEGIVSRIEYDPNRGPNIALINYRDGEKRYILAPEGLKEGMKVLASEKAEILPGNALPLGNIPLGTTVHNVEINPGRGGQLVRAAGNGAMILAKDGAFVNLQLPSGSVMKILTSCIATVGTLSNSDLRNTVLGKAGKMKYKGRRPHVRGVAMANPSDHPHAGSYRDNGVGMTPKTPWGKKARGVPTRRRRNTDKLIVKRRK